MRARGWGWIRPITALLTGAVALSVYLVTLAPDLTWANYGSDGGDLITAAVTLGVPHPHGYPTYVLLGKLFSALPIGTVAYRFNLLSALCMAGAAAFVADAVWSDAERRPLSARVAVAMATGLSLAWTPLVWGQALIAEVYALNLLVLAACLWALRTRRRAGLVGFLFGLSVTTHLTSLWLGLLLLWTFTRQRRGRDQWAALIGGGLLGVLPFLALPLLASTDSPVQWGDARTLSGWWWLVSGSLYRPNVFRLPLADLGVRLTDFLPLLLRQFAGVGWLLIGLGVWRKRQAQASVAPLLPLAALYLLYAVTYRADDYVVFALPALLLLSVRLADGLRPLGRVAFLLPMLMLALNFSDLRSSVDETVRAVAVERLNALPPDAIVLTPGNGTIFSLWYFQHVEHLRPDVILVDGNLMALDWYRERLQQMYPSLQGLEQDDVARFRRLNALGAPLCALDLSAAEADACATVPE